MGTWLQAGDAFSVAPSADSLLSGLPKGVYTIEESMQGFFFKRGGDMEKPGRVYGNHGKWADRIMNTFQDRTSNTGVLLTGDKGSGKSLLGRILVAKAAELGMPTVLINKPMKGSDVNGLLSNLSEPAVIFMDEFDKNFRDMELQESMLSLLDGTSGVRHLFIITANDKRRLSEFLVNRPGRLYYSIDFTGLERDFVLEYAEENLENKAHIEGLINITAMIGNISFDGLKALVSEMNRYNEPASEAVQLLNMKPEGSNRTYAVSILLNGKPAYTETTEWVGSPLAPRGYIYYYDSKEDAHGDQNSEAYYEFSLDDLVDVDAPSGRYIYKNGDMVLTLVETFKAPVNWHAF